MVLSKHSDILCCRVLWKVIGENIIQVSMEPFLEETSVQIGYPILPMETSQDLYSGYMKETPIPCLQVGIMQTSQLRF